MKIKVLVSKHPQLKGKVLEARKIPLMFGEAFQCIEGEYTGSTFSLQDAIEVDDLPISKAEYTELKQENLQRLEEVKGLQRRVESLTNFSNQKVKDVRRLNDEVSKAWIAYGTENEAKVLLEATLERALLDHQPVELPKEVAGAIEYYGKFTKYGIVDAIIKNPRKEDRAVYGILEKINFNDPSEILFKALVNGYTVEQTVGEVDKTESKKKDEEFVQHCKFYFEQDMFLGDFLSQVKDLAKRTYSK